MPEMLFHTQFELIDFVNQNFFEFLCVLSGGLVISLVLVFRPFNRIYCLRLCSLSPRDSQRLKVLAWTRHLHGGAPGLAPPQTGHSLLKWWLYLSADGVEFVGLGSHSTFLNVALAWVLFQTHDNFLILEYLPLQQSDFLLFNDTGWCLNHCSVYTGLLLQIDVYGWLTFRSEAVFLVTVWFGSIWGFGTWKASRFSFPTWWARLVFTARQATWF